MACYGFCSLSFCCGLSPSGLGYELSGFKAQGCGVKRVLCLQSASSLPAHRVTTLWAFWGSVQLHGSLASRAQRLILEGLIWCAFLLVYATTLKPSTLN